MPPPRLCAVLGVFAALLAPALAAGQVPAGASPSAASPAAIDRLLGQTIVEIRFEPSGRDIRDEDLRRVLETQPGTPLTAAAVRESLVHLMALARFEDVAADAEVASGGVSLVYRLTPLHTVKRLEFRGDLGLPARELRAAVEERYGASPPAVRAEEIAEMLAGRLRDRGFLKGTVRPSTEPLEKQNGTRLVFTVAAGAAATIGKAAVEGAPDGNAAAVLRDLGIQPGGRFDRLAFEDAITRYVEDLRSKAYLEARVDPDFGYAADRGSVDVVVRMSRGPRVSIAFRGDPLAEKRQSRVLALLGQGALDEDVLENEQRSIEDELHARGYRDAAAPFRRELRGETLLVVFTVALGPQYMVAAVDIVGNQSLSQAEIQAVLVVQPGQWFVASRVEADAAAIRDLYLKQGFGQAEVTVATAPQAGDATHLVNTYAITEGPRTTIDAIEFTGVSALSQSALRQVVGSRAGGPFTLARVEADREAVLDQYLAQGYQQATVTIPAGLSADGTRFTLRFEISEGERTVLDHVLVVGNARTKTSTIEQALALAAGEPLTYAALADAQRRLSDLGLFRRVTLTPLERNPGNRRDLLVSVEESPVNTIGYGGGIEGTLRVKTNAATGLPEDKLDFAPRGFFEIGRRNLWGKNRSVTLFMRGAIRTSDEFNTESAPPAESTMDDTGAGFREYRVLGTYREPRFLDLPVDLIVAGALDQAIRSSFDFNRRQVNVEGSHRFSPRFMVAGRYLFGHSRLFNERIDPASQLDIDRLFPTVRLSMFAGSVVYSTRDDAFEPTRGMLTAVDMTFAPRAIGSEVGFIKGTWQGFVYKQLPRMRGAVLASGARVGLAVGATQLVTDEQGNTTLIDQELPASERFFTGGDTTVRGWALDRLGSASVLDENGVSNGGNGLLVINVELRVPIWRRKSLGGAVFVDTGNVFAKVGDIELRQLRTGAGFGIRWRSPVGPLRMDFAWKLHPITFENGQPENPFAWYVTIGQAF
jgi:outer membrane protein insertion porin family